MMMRVVVWALLSAVLLMSLPTEAPADGCVNPSCLCDCPLPCCPGGQGIPIQSTTVRAPIAVDDRSALEQRVDPALRDVLQGIDRPPQSV